MGLRGKDAKYWISFWALLICGNVGPVECGVADFLLIPSINSTVIPVIWSVWWTEMWQAETHESHHHRHYLHQLVDSPWATCGWKYSSYDTRWGLWEKNVKWGGTKMPMWIKHEQGVSQKGSLSCQTSARSDWKLRLICFQLCPSLLLLFQLLFVQLVSAVGGFDESV